MLIDQKQRDGILTDDNSIVISASAGSGKTTIMVEKIKIELGNIVNHKTVAAITFTVRAAAEIKRKALKVNISREFLTLTNDSFIEHEIIRPFISDAYGIEYSDDYIVEYGNEYKFATFENGKQKLLVNNIMGSFRDIKKNFNFQVASDILDRSLAARQYIQAKYATIFIDEYQDSDLDMHIFFMKLKNQLGIKLFIVGDSKQAIYLWRGASKTTFSLLAEEKFSYYELITNFRCHPEIQNYANLFHNPDYLSIKDELSVEKVLHCELTNFVDDINRLVAQGEIDVNKEITVIANFNRDALEKTNQLNGAGYRFVYIPRTPLDDGIPNGHLLKELACFTKDYNYSLFDFIENTNLDGRKQTTLEVEAIIKDLKNNKYWTVQHLTKVILRLFEYLQLSVSENEVKKFCDSIMDNQYEMAFLNTEEKHKVMTVFASKGLEFKQVISFSSYYPIYKNENRENHYVCITRAEEKFVMFINEENYNKHLKRIVSESNVGNIKNIIKYV